MLAFLAPVAPSLPGLAHSITPSLAVTAGAKNLYSFNWLFGFVVSIVLYTALSWAFPARETLLTDTIWSDEPIDGVRTPAGGSDIEKAAAARGGLASPVGGGEKPPYHESDAKPL